MFDDALPYIVNLYSSFQDTLNDPVYYDKYDYLNPTDLNSIACDFKFKEIRGNKSSYMLKISDINAYFRPSDDDYLAYFEISMNGYEDYSQTATAIASDIPLDRELYFDKVLDGQVLKFGFSTSDSGFKLINCEYFLDTYDKALYPNKSAMTESDLQDEIANMIFWLTRGSKLANYDYVGQSLWSVTSASKIDGPDGKTESAILLEQSSDFEAGKLYFWTTSDPASIGTTSLGSLDVEGTTWYFVFYDNASGDFNPGIAYSVADIRIYSSSLSINAINYIIDDFKNNSGDIVCNAY